MSDQGAASPCWKRFAPAGSPREVYFADWDASDPTDEVCDVAFPVS